MPSYHLEPAPIDEKGDIVAGDPAERRTDRILLGRLSEAGARRNVWLDTTGEQVVAIFGKRGTGKSYTLGVLLEGLAAGAGSSPLAALSTPRCALLFDLLDIYWTSIIPLAANGPSELTRQFEVMRRAGYSSQDLNVAVWVPAGFENPILDPISIRSLRVAPSDLSLDDWASLFDLDVFNEPRGMLLVDVLQHVREGYTRLDGAHVSPNETYLLTDLVSCISNDRDFVGYQDATRRSLQQRFTTYASLELFQGKGTASGELLQPFFATIVMLGRVPDSLKQVIIAVLLRRVIRERRDASFAQKRLQLDGSLNAEEKQTLDELVKTGTPRTWVLIDEAQIVAGADSGSVARDALVKYAKEGRNYGLSLAVATQQPAALDSRLLSQVETLIAHQLTAPNDLAVAVKAIRSPQATDIQIDGERASVDELLRRLRQGEAVFSSGNAPALRRFVVTAVRPRTTAHGGYEA